tara:strand:- start:2285 stop:2590 length:306 start_codon:yes stop_codon:yes gene_type:complete
MSERIEYYVYIMTNKRNTVLYTGITNEIGRRIHEHKSGSNPKSFTSRYSINKIVYIESYDSVEDVIMREKQIKKGPRKRKIQLIESINPKWEDLSNEILQF